MLSKQDLERLGYKFSEDPDQQGKFCWSHNQGGCEVSFDTEAEAILDAAQDAREVYELHRCDNCGKVHSEETIKDVDRFSERVEAGGTMPSGECADCGCLCYPVGEDPDWKLVSRYFGLDDSFQYSAEKVIEYTTLYQKAAQNAICVPKDVLETLIAMAGSHVEDVKSGIEEGIYSAEDNQDMASKQQAYNTASALFRDATQGAQQNIA